MILGILGDLHFTNRAPERRLDNYFETQLFKFNQALTIFDDNTCSCIIQPGDFFDTPTVANRVKSAIISLLRKRGIKIYCCAGQHDITGHSLHTLSNSPLAVLEAAEVVKVLNFKPAMVEVTNENSNASIALYGASFGEEVPIPRKDTYNILVTHRMIGNRRLYPGQVLIDPKRFLKEHSSYNGVVVGDYHYRFIETWNGRTIINSGAIVRKTISEFDLEHKPAVVIFDTETNETKVIELDVQPVKKVFNLTRITQKNSATLLQFIEELKKRNTIKREGWKHILLKVLKERNSDKKVGEIIDDCLEEIKIQIKI